MSVYAVPVASRYLFIAEIHLNMNMIAIVTLMLKKRFNISYYLGRLFGPKSSQKRNLFLLDFIPLSVVFISV